MKKNGSVMYSALIVGLLSIGVSDFSFAQTSRAGIKGGLNVSKLYINDASDENARYGFNVGVFGQPLSTEAFAVQLELLYSTKGSEAHYNGLFSQDVSYNLNYLELPVLAVIKLGEDAELHAGAYASYLLNANIAYQGLVNGTQEIDKGNLKSMDYGLIGGMGLNLGNVQIGARFSYGLVKIADSTNAQLLLGDSKNICATIYAAINLSK